MCVCTCNIVQAVTLYVSNTPCPPFAEKEVTILQIVLLLIATVFGLGLLIALAMVECCKCV